MTVTPDGGTVYLDQIGQQIWEELPNEAFIPELYRIYAILALSGKDATLEDVHNAWAAWQTLKDENHSALIPFDDLVEIVQEMDRPFAEAINKVRNELRAAWYEMMLQRIELTEELLGDLDLPGIG